MGRKEGQSEPDRVHYRFPGVELSGSFWMVPHSLGMYREGRGLSSWEERLGAGARASVGWAGLGSFDLPTLEKAWTWAYSESQAAGGAGLNKGRGQESVVPDSSAF